MKISSFMLLVVALAGLAPAARSEPRPTTTRASVRNDGREAPNVLGWNGPVAISGDGNVVAFGSTFALVDDDRNNTTDVYVRERVGAITERVSVTSDETEFAEGTGDYYSSSPSISWDGRFVAFGTGSTWGNGDGDIFVRDRVAGTTELVSVGMNGSAADGVSGYPSISADGRYVAFISWADNLVPADTNEHADVFVRDLHTATTETVSVSATGVQGNDDSVEPSISADGSSVAFTSDASNLVQGDRRGSLDVFVRDRSAGTTRRVTNAADDWRTYCEFAAGPSLSADGRFVSFNCAPIIEPLSIEVVDLQTGNQERVSISSGEKIANARSWGSSISSDGRYVAFASEASDLVLGDTNGARDFFVRDRLRGETYVVSVSSLGEQQISYDGTVLTGFDHPAISGNGRVVTFESWASNLVVGDANGSTDVFVWEQPDECQSGAAESGTLSRVSRQAQRGPTADQARALNCDIIVAEGL